MAGPFPLRSCLSSRCEQISQPVVVMAHVSGMSHSRLVCADNKHCPLVLGVSILCMPEQHRGLPFLCQCRTRSDVPFLELAVVKVWSVVSPSVSGSLLRCPPVLGTVSDIRISQPSEAGLHPRTSTGFVLLSLSHQLGGDGVGVDRMGWRWARKDSEAVLPVSVHRGSPRRSRAPWPEPAPRPRRPSAP